MTDKEFKDKYVKNKKATRRTVKLLKKARAYITENLAVTKQGIIQRDDAKTS